MKQVLKFIVSAFKEPGPAWHDVSKPVDRPEALALVQAHWRLGRYSRVRKKEVVDGKRQSA